SIGAAAPALGELRPQALAAGAGPFRALLARAKEQLLRAWRVRIVQDPQLGFAFGRRQLAHRRGEGGVPHQHFDAFGLEQIPRVVYGGLVEGAEDALHQRWNSASHFAAQMKSFSESPPMACVAYSTRHLL